MLNEKTAQRRAFLINLAYFATIGLLIFVVLKYVLKLFVPFIIGFILVSIINPVIKKIQSKFPERRSAIAVILMFAVYLIVAGLVFLLIFSIFIQLSKAAEYISSSYYPDVMKPALNDIWAYISQFIDDMPIEWQTIAYNMQDNIMTQLQNFVVGLAPNVMSGASRFSSALPGFFIAFIFTIMMSFVMSIQYENVTGFVRAQCSPKVLQVINDLKIIMRDTVLNYIKALIILMFITLVELMIGFTILGIESKILIAVIIAILDAFPVLGTGTILIPWALVKLIQQEYKTALGLMIIYVAITVIRRLLEPKIIGDQLDMNPIVSLVSIYAGYKAIGMFGMILTPIVAQMLMELHKRGTIKLYKTAEKPEVKAKKELKNK